MSDVLTSKLKFLEAGVLAFLCDPADPVEQERNVGLGVSGHLELPVG